VVEAVEEVKAAEARFVRLVGHPSGKLSNPPGIGSALPADVVAAIRFAQQNNPTVLAAQADVNAAHGRVKGADSAFYPTVSLEARARAGHDLEGVPGDDHELRAGVVLNWNLYRGGIDRANRQEQIRRMDEATMVLYSISREVEEAVKLSWDRREQQAQRLVSLRRQLGRCATWCAPTPISSPSASARSSTCWMPRTPGSTQKSPCGRRRPPCSSPSTAFWRRPAGCCRRSASRRRRRPSPMPAPRPGFPPPPPPETLIRTEPGLGPLY
jgi:hypothetical protein